MEYYASVKKTNKKFLTSQDTLVSENNKVQKNI